MAFLLHNSPQRYFSRLKIVLLSNIKDYNIIWVSDSRQLLVVFGLRLIRKLAQLLFEGKLSLCLRKLLLFDDDSFWMIFFLADFHLVIDLFHEDDFGLFIFGVFLSGRVFMGEIVVCLCIDSSSSGFVHAIIVYKQVLIFPTINIKLT